MIEMKIDVRCDTCGLTSSLKKTETYLVSGLFGEFTHELTLQRWLFERNDNGHLTKVSCPSCASKIVTSESTKLRPCPFCGSEASIYYESDGVGYVSCKNGHGTPDYSCIGTSVSGIDREWNKRPIEDALRARIAELEVDAPFEAVCAENERLKEALKDIRLCVPHINDVNYRAIRMAEIANKALKEEVKA